MLPSSISLTKMPSHTVLFSVFRGRCYSQMATPASAFAKPQQSQVKKTKTVAHSYYIPRNSRGSLPVYTDIRNGGSRHVVRISNVQGNISALRDDIASSLFQYDSPEAAKLCVETPRKDTLILYDGRWKHRVMDWLRLKGF